MKAYTIHSPVGDPLPVVASIPHGGTALPRGYGERMASDAMRALPMTDWHLPTLFDFLPALGVTVIAAEVSRFVIDLNRPPDGEALYPGRFETGLVPLEGFDGAPVFSEPPTDDEIAQARCDIYEPYHSALALICERRREAFGVIQLDLHSVTPHANRISGPLTQDIMLGDRDGASCETWLTEAVREAYAQAGFSVTRNNPYKGGWITESAGRRPGVQALQIEMNWAVYMDPDQPAAAVAAPQFDVASERLRSVFEMLLPAVCARLRQE
ncbi:MAG: N-formylglutamate amidohydrolase [Gammaproteobacteria bacterium]